MRSSPASPIRYPVRYGDARGVQARLEDRMRLLPRAHAGGPDAPDARPEAAGPEHPDVREDERPHDRPAAPAQADSRRDLATRGAPMDDSLTRRRILIVDDHPD